jgi:hypothetical protein
MDEKISLRVSGFMAEEGHLARRSEDASRPVS